MNPYPVGYPSYGKNLAVLSLPTIRLLLDDSSREYYNKIIYIYDHVLHLIIQLNQYVRELTSVCQTTKYDNIFFQYAHDG